MKNFVFSAKAHPTMGIVLLGGLKDDKNRLPYHNSAGIAYTIKGRESVTHTELRITEQIEKSYINGVEIDTNDSRSPFKVMHEFQQDFKNKYDGMNISFRSHNENIISGSSDSGAAAFGYCLKQALSIQDERSLELKMRRISESAGRSYYGGLTVTEGTDNPATRKILSESEFSDYSIVAAVFPHKRLPSDSIHFNQPKHEEYIFRIERANKRVERLKYLAEKKSIRDIFELSMEDTDDYHNLNNKVDVRIITNEMRDLIDEIKTMRDKVWLTYIVTGGSSVFIPCRSRDVETAIAIGKKFTENVYELKVTGGAEKENL
ncbi:mevalonate-3-kinase [Caldiplasma sukawensis]